jgi:hypothetical protein
LSREWVGQLDRFASEMDPDPIAVDHDIIDGRRGDPRQGLRVDQDQAAGDTVAYECILIIEQPAHDAHLVGDRLDRRPGASATPASSGAISPPRAAHRRNGRMLIVVLDPRSSQSSRCPWRS